MASVARVVKKKTKMIGLEGNHVSHLRKDLMKDIQNQDSVSRIVRSAADAVENFTDLDAASGERRGLIFGKIQSGKTNVITASLAVAADNGYKFFIVLTSDNIWLYEQSLGRLLQALLGMSIYGKDAWEQQVSAIKTRLKNSNTVVLVSTKNGTNLSKLSNIVSEIGAAEYPAVIFDDEADQASLNTNASKEDDDPSKINALITEIRNKFKVRTYVQVTATPQALFLQGIDKPYRPEFTILTEPGEGYVGGEIFFGQPESPLLCKVDEEEIDSLKSSKTQKVNKTIPTGLRQALYTFYIGATIKFMKGEGQNFSFLCHVSVKKADHEHIRQIMQKEVDNTETALKTDDEDKKKFCLKEFKKAYDNLALTLPDMPPLDEVLDQLSFLIANTDIQVLNTDSRNTGGQPRYHCVYNVLIGGTKLGRGVTIKRLLVTYYGRQTRRPQMDTVLQHARMYGYREKDLDVSRIFLPSHLSERFRIIYESENALREIIAKYKDEGLRGIWLSKELKATRSNVLDPNELGIFAAGRTYFPHKPKYKKKSIADNTRELDSLLSGYSDTKENAVKVPIEFIMDLLKYTKTEKNSPGLWKEERVLMALEKLKHDYKEAYLIVKRGRKLSRQESARGLGAVYQSKDLEHAGKELPTLLMLRQEGTKKLGWDGQEFWIPALRFPEGNFALMFTI